MGLALFLPPGLRKAVHRTAGVLTPALDSSGPAATALVSMLCFYRMMRVGAALASVVSGVIPGLRSAARLVLWRNDGRRAILGYAGVLIGLF